MKAFIDVNVKLKYRYNLSNKKNSYKYINKIINLLIFKLFDMIIHIKSIKLKNKNNFNQNYSFSSIDSIIN